MIDKIIRMKCDYCGNEEFSSPYTKSLKVFLKKCESWGWKTYLTAGEDIKHFCNDECLEKHKNSNEKAH